MKAVFLDRDGVIVRTLVRDGLPFAVSKASEMEIELEAREALEALRDLGFLLFVVSNQPEVARGALLQSELEAMNRALLAALPLDGIYICPHENADGCSCRKPLPGLILRAASDRAIDLAKSYMVGDRWRDVDAGRAAGCRTVWIDRGYRERLPSLPPHASVASLTEAVRWIESESAGE